MLHLKSFQISPVQGRTTHLSEKTDMAAASRLQASSSCQGENGCPWISTSTVDRKKSSTGERRQERQFVPVVQHLLRSNQLLIHGNHD